MKDKIKNAYLYAYYECYLQTHIYYKEHKNKNFYSVLSLGFPLWLLLVFPILMIIDKTIGLPPKIYLYPLIAGVAYGYIYFTSWLVGNEDITDKINTFYDNKKVIRESGRIIIGFVVLCIGFWVFVLRYDGY